MQIRLTVLAPRSGHPVGRACDVLVTAPAGTALATVASGLASAAAGPDVPGTVVLYAGRERLDAQRRTLGEPPLVDGAVLSLQVPGEDDAPADDVPAQLHVVAGPDAGGVHLLHGGQIRIGRSADADVPLDDPDVSRLHCAVTVSEDGRVSVADLDSTNGTTLEGGRVGSRPVPLPPGALLRLGESALRLTSGGGMPALTATPDGEGHLRVGRAEAGRAGGEDAGARLSRDRPAVSGTYGGPRSGPDAGSAPGGRTVHAYGHEGPAVTPRVPDPRGTRSEADTRYGDALYVPQPGAGGGRPAHDRTESETTHGAADDGPQGHSRAPGSRRQGTPTRGTELPEGPGRRRGIGAWARRLAGTRDEEFPGDEETPVAGGHPGAGRAPLDETWPDPASVLMTALGPGPRLWERGPRHPESLVVRLGTAESGGPGAAPVVPVTVGLREAGSLGLAGPRERLTGLARSVVAQLAALHSPADLEIVLVSADRATGLERRKREWGWLGWLPHTRPAHGQDCRLLLAYDRDQAAARLDELTRRLDEGPLGTAWASADDVSVAESARRYRGPVTLLVLDGDPGSAALRERAARLAGAGAVAGVHVLCLAETPAASALSPVTATYETACAASVVFRECGAMAVLSGDVATALRLLRATVGQPLGQGALAAVDAVSTAWADRFGRALAPLRTEAGGGAPGRGRQAAALPRSARLLDELGLARATPASLMARWASAADGATAVLGTGPHGPVTVDLVEEGPHLLIEGPPGSGRTESLRAVAASLAAGGRPDRLGVLLVDGAGGERGEGLGACTELPHVTEHLVASDPVRMREFARALGAELKRRAEVLGRLDFAEWHNRREVAERMVGQRAPGPAERGGAPRERFEQQVSGDGRSGGTGPGGPERSPAAGGPGGAQPGGVRVRQGVSRTRGEPGPGPLLPRLVVLVDDYDALVAPALGSPGRPAAGSVVRALEAIARDGERLGVHLVATSARPDRTAETDLAARTRLRAVLDTPLPSPGPDDPLPGRGRLGRPDGQVTPFQGGRVTGRIPRTATLRPTVVPLEWERMGDPPARRPVRELGNGPTDLALLASALERAARSVSAVPVGPLGPV
ncbi:FHA domain-containing protein [Streptomyces sp. NBC_01498]|uniref:FHA domain-containing protein n=1 Tax=Streptomyces sp. NBC_01498 TaxID=2975870 RepID=UPI002E7B3E48|nr:FHA domain-containing protein [Streptomyces sp. NBC_01498]WTL28911.1 FHA domain-containing protein [Streptomyces sp. NBC_01498]